MKYLLPFFFLCSTIFAAEAQKKPYLVYLKPGTILTKLSDKKEVQLPKGIYAKVLETSPTRRDLFIVFDKDGKAAYETTALGVVEIADDIQILPKIDAELVYPPATTLKSNDRHAFFDTQFNLYLESMQTSAFDSIYNQELPSALSNRYELRTVFVSSFPVNFGLAINYQTAYWSNDVDKEIKLSIFSFGPVVEHYIYEGEELSFSVLGGAEYAPVYKTSAGPLVEKYTAVLLDLGLEGTWATSYGKFTAGAHYRRHDLALANTNRTTTQPVPEEIIINSIGGMIGYKYEWDL